MKTRRSRSTWVSPVQVFKATTRKLPHWQSPGQVYYITFSATFKITFSPADKDIILNSCLFWHQKKYLLHAAVIMPDHVHLLLQPLPIDQANEMNGHHNLSGIMHSIKSFSSHRINEIRKRRGQIWLNESHDRIVRSKKEYQQKMRYIYENPSKSKLVEDPKDYKWLWLLSSEC